MKSGRTIDPRFLNTSSQSPPLPISAYSILDANDPRSPRIGKYEFRSVLSQGCLCNGIRPSTKPREEARWGGEMVVPEEVLYECEERWDEADGRYEGTR